MAPFAACSALALLLLCLLATAAGEPPKDLKKDERGNLYLTTDAGERWNIIGDVEGQHFFLNEKSKTIAYQDPRVYPPKQPSETDVDGVQQDESGVYFITHKGVRFTVHRDTEGSGRVYYHNAESKTTTWDDPRAPPAEDPFPLKKTPKSEYASFTEEVQAALDAARVPAVPPSSPAERMRLAMVAVVPVLLFIAGLAARIYYLHTHYPELLFPTKERKDRRRSSSGKLKPQKARGKMSQDGKGGRSANS